MRTLRRMMFIEISKAICLVTLAFLALFFVFDFSDQIPDIGRVPSYTSAQALLYAAAFLPAHVYELLPITVMIGSIFVLIRLAERQEFTIMRVSGLGPWQMLRSILVFGLFAAVFSFVVGDYVSPWSNSLAQEIRVRHFGESNMRSANGIWLRQADPVTKNQYTINVKQYDMDAQTMRDVHIFETSPEGRLLTLLRAKTAGFSGVGMWTLEGVQRTRIVYFAQQQTEIERSTQERLQLALPISEPMLFAAALKPDRMNTVELYRYAGHLKRNAQSAQNYEIALWRRIFYPLSALVMVIMALPFAYLHLRGAGITGYVFTGVMVGISFFLLNNVFGYLGVLNNWLPWLSAAAPGLIYLLISLAAFFWLVLRH